MLLSSLEGAAVTSIQLRDVYQEFSTIPGVKEDVTQIVLNVKKLRLKSFATHPVQLRLVKSGAGRGHRRGHHRVGRRRDRQPGAGPDDPRLGRRDDRGGPHRRARRRLPRRRAVASRCRSASSPIDAIFTPVRKVNYWVETTRVGQITNYDKLTIEIETDGTISPEEALARAADILVRQFPLFANIGHGRHRGRSPGGGAPQLPPNMLDMPIEELDLPMRAYNSLKRNNIVKVGQLLQLSDDDLLRMRNFGKKSLDEMKERLRMRGFVVPETEPIDDDLPMSRSPTTRPRRSESMAHRIDGRKLSRKQGPRLALYKNLTVSVLRYERIKTTEAKAKEIRGRVERMITLAKRGDLAARRAVDRRSSRTSRSSSTSCSTRSPPKYADRTLRLHPDRPRLGQRLGRRRARSSSIELV